MDTTARWTTKGRKAKTRQYSDTHGGLLHYRRHFTALLCVTLALAACGRLPLGIASGGTYGLIYASMLAFTWRAPLSGRQRLSLAGCGAALGLLNIACSVAVAGASGVSPGSPGMAVLLGMASAAGAAVYTATLRPYGACFDLRSSAAICAGCSAATLAVFACGLQLRAGALWTFVSWWFAFSGGCWWQDRRAWRVGR